MYYYVDKKSEIIQTSNLRYRNNSKSQKTPLGKILSELINFDYNRLFEYYNSLDDKEKRKYTNIKINGVCKETENVLQQLLLPVFYIRKNSNFISIINKITENIIELCGTDNYDCKFIEFYFDRIYTIKPHHIQFPLERYATIPIAPILSQYEWDYNKISLLLSECNGNIPKRNNEQRLTAHKDLFFYLKRNNISDIHYSICEKFSTNATKMLHKLNLNDLHKYNLTKKEQIEYAKLVYEYENGNKYLVHTLSEFLVVSYIHCCKEKIKIAECSECGGIYFKYSKNKYCSVNCKNNARKKQEGKRVCEYISEHGEKSTLNYNTVFRNFETKIKRIIQKIENGSEYELENITAESRNAILKEFRKLSGLPRLNYQEYKDRILKLEDSNDKKFAENALANWLSCFNSFSKHKNENQTKNVIFNEYKKAIETQKDCILKIPTLTDDFKLEYEDYTIHYPKYS